MSALAWLGIAAILIAAALTIASTRRPARPARDVGTFDALVADVTASDYEVAVDQSLDLIYQDMCFERWERQMGEAR